MYFIYCILNIAKNYISLLLNKILYVVDKSTFYHQHKNVQELYISEYQPLILFLLIITVIIKGIVILEEGTSDVSLGN